MVSESSMSSTALLIEPHYLPCQEFLAHVLEYDQLILDGESNYIKQSYRNRCKILSANKVMELSVPIKKPYNQKPLKEAQIDYRHGWTKDHWMSIQSAYGKAPFFEFYSEAFHHIIFSKPKFLFDLNLELLQKILQFLKISKTVTVCEKYVTIPGGQVADLRSKVQVKTRPGNYDFYQPIPYNQVFGNIFVENLSIIDLLFCEGPEAVTFLEKSVLNSRKNN